MTDLIINKYYQSDSQLHYILVEHGKAVKGMAHEVLAKHPELDVDVQFIEETAMLHDIGIYLTHAPGIFCHGDKPYICHGYLGREILERENLPKHALVCERHTGAGLTKEDIIFQDLPIPQRDMLPISLEEEIICFADKFYSKSHDMHKRKSLDHIRRTMAHHSERQLKRFDEWCERFL